MLMMLRYLATSFHLSSASTDVRVFLQVYRKNWMFRLVGSETFKIGKKVAEIAITSNGMSFEYVLTIDGKSLKKFVEVQAKNTRVWLPKFGEGSEHRVVLGK